MNENDSELTPDLAAAYRWFAEMQRRYPEPRPTSEDPSDIQAWTERGFAWAQTTDPEGASAAMTALCEDAVAEGILEHAGVDEHGRTVYRSLIYRGD